MPIDKPLSKTKLRNAAIAAKSAALPKIPNELIDQIVKGQPMTGEEVNAADLLGISETVVPRRRRVVIRFDSSSHPKH